MSKKRMAAMMQEVFVRDARTRKPGGFVLNEVEQGRAEVFRQLHASIGGRHRDMPAKRFAYEFTQTGIGTKVIIKCRCAAEKDITDYEQW